MSCNVLTFPQSGSIYGWFCYSAPPVSISPLQYCSIAQKTRHKKWVHKQHNGGNEKWAERWRVASRDQARYYKGRRPGIVLVVYDYCNLHVRAMMRF